MKKQNRTALVYVRAASQEMEQSEASIQEQAEACRNYCKKNNLDVLVEITEHDSGLALFDFGLTKQIKLIVTNRHDIDAFVTHDISRISRNSAVVNKFMKDMEKLGLQLHLVKDNPRAELSMAIAKSYSEELSRRVKAGIERKKQEQEKNRTVRFIAKGRNGKKYKCQTTMVKPTITRQIN